MEQTNPISWTKLSTQSIKTSPYFSVEETFPTLITPEFQSLIENENKMGPLSRQFLTSPEEESNSGLEDPIGDQVHQKTPMLIHRYKNRALFMPTTRCPVHCRYCFRRNELEVADLFKPSLDETLHYLHSHPEIEEIIFTGGDPLVLSDDKIAFYLEKLSGVPHLKWIRFHTRTPVAIPERLTLELKNILLSFKERFEQIIIILHTNHISELTTNFKHHFQNFYDPRIPWLSQSVLLKGVNDSPHDLSFLFKELSRHAIRPYYLHHPDQVKGAMHFYLSLEEGRKIYHQLRDQLPGWMLPHYVVDIEGGHGKTPAASGEKFEYEGQLLDRHGHSRPHRSSAP